MKVLLCLCALVAAAFAGAPSNKYLPPHFGAASAPEPAYQAAASAPSNQYLAPRASVPAPSYQSAPAFQTQSFQAAASAPAVSFAPAPVQSFAPAPAPAAQSFAPAQTFQAAASVPAPAFVSAPAPAAVQTFAQAPAPAVQTFQPQAAASEPVPAHTFSDADGYRYKTHRRVVYRRHRRDVSTEYLPPHQGAASAPLPSNEYLPPHQGAGSAPVASFSAPEPDFSVAESAPAHSFSSADGYRYKTQRRRVVRRRRY